jgi:hypothetical protein
VLNITRKKTDNGKPDEGEDKCSCGCGQDLTPRDTPYWPIDGDVEERKEVFGEGCREDDNRVTNAERGLHSRMTEDERVEALRWSAYYRALVRDGVDD